MTLHPSRLLSDPHKDGCAGACDAGNAVPRFPLGFIALGHQQLMPERSASIRSSYGRDVAAQIEKNKRHPKMPLVPYGTTAALEACPQVALSSAMARGLYRV